MPNLSIIILTHNEAVNIEKCLHSAKKLTNNIYIIDSFSDDLTLEICKKYQVTILQNQFVNQGIQFNWALKNLNLETEWILRLDADEEVSEELEKNIRNIIESDNKKTNGYFINRKLIWCGKWIRFGGIYPHWIARLFRNGTGKYEERTEEHLLVNGNTARIKGSLIENNLKNKIIFFSQKHIATAQGEVSEYFDISFNSLNDTSGVFSKNYLRRLLKLSFYNKLPIYLRCCIYFLYRYIFLLGFLDGKHGFSFHFFQSFWYRMLIDILIYEKKNN
jgi:glycosyltransferase involved in cell wall biosynthesis